MVLPKTKRQHCKRKTRTIYRCRIANPTRCAIRHFAKDKHFRICCFLTKVAEQCATERVTFFGASLSVAVTCALHDGIQGTSCKLAPKGVELAYIRLSANCFKCVCPEVCNVEIFVGMCNSI